MITLEVGRRFLAASALSMLALAGCASSPPVEYYALQPQRMQPRGAFVAAPLQIARVHLPPVLDRREIVRQAAPFRIEMSDRHRWGAPLDEMIRRTLTEDLQEAMPPAEIVLPEEPAPPQTRKVVIDILRFSPDPQGKVRLEASWSIIAPGSGAAPKSGVVNTAVQMTSTGYSAQVDAMSRALGKLADEIVLNAG